MVKSKATTVEEYLTELPEDRRAEVSAVRTLVLKYLPKGYVETMNWGMISYEVPLAMYPETYNGQPLCYAALASQKNHLSLYLLTGDADAKEETALKEAFRKAGKKLDMGKSCIRFRTMDDLVPDAIGKVIKSMPPKKFIAYYEASRAK